MKFNVKVFKCVYFYIYYFFSNATHIYKIVFINSQKQCDSTSPCIDCSYNFILQFFFPCKCCMMILLLPFAF